MTQPLADAGYSGTPLPKKLGFKPGQSAAFVCLPPALAPLAEAEAFAGVERAGEAAELGPTGPHDVILAFYTGAHAMEADLNCLKAVLKPAGMIWIGWPRKAAKVVTDITEDVIRRRALEIGLVDVKVCAMSEVWSGLKLVIPVAQREKV